MASTGSSEAADKSSSGFIRFEADVNKITSSGMFSPAIEVMEMPWKLEMKQTKEITTESGDVIPPYLRVHLYHRESKSFIWSIDVSAEISLINAEEGKNILTKFTGKFSHETASCGANDNIKWDDAIDIDKGFVKDGKITVEARFTLSNFVGIRTIERIDFTDANDDRHDVALLFGEKKVYVSKQILAVHSPVFNSMFYGGFVEKGKKEIEVQDVDRKEFVEMLNLIYPSYEKITDDKVEFLLKIADRFQIKFITDKVEQYLIDSTELKTATTLKLSDQFRLVKLQDHCFDSLKTVKDIQNLKTTDEYKALTNIARAGLLETVMSLG